MKPVFHSPQQHSNLSVRQTITTIWDGESPRRSELPVNVPIEKLIPDFHPDALRRKRPVVLICKKAAPAAQRLTTLERMQAMWRGEKLTSSSLEHLLLTTYTHTVSTLPRQLRPSFLQSLSQTTLGVAVMKKAIKEMDPDRLHLPGMYEAMARTLRDRELRLRKHLKLSHIDHCRKRATDLRSSL